MFGVVDAPYLLPIPQMIDSTAWSREVGDEVSPLVSPLSDWSAGSDVLISRTLEVNGPEVLEVCGLGPGCVLGIVVSWISDATKVRKRVFLQEVDNNPIFIRATLRGDEISGTIDLETSLVLLKNPNNQESWVASLPGSVLLKELYQVTLEGEASVFPMAVLNFASTVYDPDSSWAVQMSSNIEAKFSSMFQVLVNELDGKLIAAIEATKPTREQTALLDEMASSALQTVLELAYSLKGSGELTANPLLYERGTVGNVLAGFLKQTGDLDMGDFSDLSQITRRRSVFAGMARRIGAGRVF